jgi:hypothetical protein
LLCVDLVFPTVFIVLTCVQIIAQAEENVRLITTATLLSVNVQKTGKVKRVTFLTVQTTVVFLIKASAIQVMSEDAPASQSGRVGASFSYFSSQNAFSLINCN